MTLNNRQIRNNSIRLYDVLVRISGTKVRQRRKPLDEVSYDNGTYQRIREGIRNKDNGAGR